MRRLFLTALLAFVPCAHAQVLEIYATFSPTHAGNVQTGSLLSGGVYVNQYTSFTAPAIGGGVTLNVLPLGPVRVGFDLRGSTKQGTTGIDTGLLGLKVSFKPPVLRIKPYVQVSGGYVETRSGNVTIGSSGATFVNQYAAIEGIAGIDTHLLPLLNLRLLEVGYGKGYNAGISFGTNSSSNNLNFFTINSGLVFHF